MQVSDLLFQYQNNLASGSEISTGTKGIEQLVETAKQLKVGNIFEGTINNIKGNQVILGLSSGQNITARLDGKVDLVKGQSVFFQVKQNDGNQIQIKPVSLGGNAGNPTLVRALDAASLPVNEKNLNMVNVMMKEQMPIDAKSLQAMSRQIIQIPKAEPQTVVEMTKLQLPITKESVVQYQDYKIGAGEVLQDMKQIVDNVVDTFEEISPVIENEVPEMEVNLSYHREPIKLLKDFVSVFTDKVEVSNQVLPVERSISAVIPQETLENFSKEVTAIDPAIVQEKEVLFTENGVLRSEMSVKDFIKAFTEYIDKNPESIDKASLEHVVQRKEFKNLLLELITQEWSLKPEQLTQEHSVRDLYQRIQEDLARLQETMANHPKVNESVLEATKNLSDNIDFMNQVNQTYHFVQIPLKMTQQNINGELYVYRNHRQHKDANEPLSAFLHFDMEYLGGMDISVQLQGKNVTTNWYLDSEEALDLLEANIHLLESKLEAKGYYCTTQLEKSQKRVNFVEDFLKADAKTGGQVHRYSFDVRA